MITKLDELIKPDQTQNERAKQNITRNETAPQLAATRPYNEQ